MKKTGRFKQLILDVGLLILLLLIAYALVWYGRAGLPEYSRVGVEDMRSMVYFFTSLSLLCVFFGRYLIVFVLSLCVMCLTIANWWYYSFYRTFISFSDLKIGQSAFETTRSFSALLDVPMIVMYVLPVFFLLWGLKWLIKYNPNRSMLVLALSFLCVGLGLNYQHRLYEQGFLMPGSSSDVSLYFLRSMLDERVESKQEVTKEERKALSAFSGVTELSDSKYPLQHVVNNTEKERRYNVILVMLESVQAARMGLYNEALKKVGLTKNLDYIAREHFYHERAYANSVQTVRAELTTLCSLYDMSKGAPISTYSLPLHAKCLPHVLQDNGYKTFWFHGYDLNVFSRDKFHPKLGFDYLYDQEKLSANIDEIKHVGWGISDEQVLVSALDVLEKQEELFFAEILTLSNHYPFDHDWDISFSNEIEILYKESVDKGDQVYADLLKGIAYTDYSVGKFWQKFKQSRLVDNTIVYFLSDHGVWVFPREEENVFEKNEAYFRIPWIEYHPDGEYLSSNQNKVSQLNFASTVLKSLGLSAEVSFMGEAVDQQANDELVLAKVGGYAVRDSKKLCLNAEDTEDCGGGYQNCYKPVKENDLACALYREEHQFVSFSARRIRGGGDRSFKYIEVF